MGGTAPDRLASWQSQNSYDPPPAGVPTSAYTAVRTEPTAIHYSSKPTSHSYSSVLRRPDGNLFTAFPRGLPEKHRPPQKGLWAMAHSHGLVRCAAISRSHELPPLIATDNFSYFYLFLHATKHRTAGRDHGVRRCAAALPWRAETSGALLAAASAGCISLRTSRRYAAPPPALGG